MKTPDQIRDMEFQKTAMGGYKQSDVEVFLEEMASQIELLTRQKAEAERKLQELSKNASDGALTTAGIQNVLVSAQRVAEQIVDEAKQEADGVKADAALAVTEAEVNAKEIKAKAEEEAALLFKTATQEASKIIEEARAKAEKELIAARESVDLEQKLYDRIKIEVSDFRKKAATQCAAVIELINQLPDDIGFNIERAKTVLSIDFTNPEELLQNAVNAKLEEQESIAEAEQKLADEEAVKEAQEREEAIRAAIRVAEQSSKDVEEDELEEEEQEEERPEATPVVLDVAEEPEAEEEIPEEVQFSFEELAEIQEPEFVMETQSETQPKGRISFGIDDDDDDDDDDEPRLFFRRKKK